MVAQERGYDPMIGRELEVEEISEILCRRNKNNPMLLGEPGVGKTALIEAKNSKTRSSRIFIKQTNFFFGFRFINRWNKV